MIEQWTTMGKNPRFSGWILQKGKEEKAYLSDWKLEALNDQENISKNVDVIFMQDEFWIYGQAITQSIIGHCIWMAATELLASTRLDRTVPQFFFPFLLIGKNSSWEKHLLWAECRLY